MVCTFWRLVTLPTYGAHAQYRNPFIIIGSVGACLHIGEVVIPCVYLFVFLVFTARRYGSAVLAVIVCLFVCPSVCHKSELYKDS